MAQNAAPQKGTLEPSETPAPSDWLATIRRLQSQLDKLAAVVVVQASGGQAYRDSVSAAAGMLYEAKHALRTAVAVLKTSPAQEGDERIVQRMHAHALELAQAAQRLLDRPFDQGPQH
jgi:hypothetical protein